MTAAAGAAAGRLAEQAANDGLLDVAYTTLDSPVGPVLVAATPRGLVRISFCSHYDHDDVLLELSEQISPRVIEAPSYFDAVRARAGGVLPGPPHALRPAARLAADRRLRPAGAEAHRRDPLREGLHLQGDGGRAGSPRGARAAGNALGSNPIPIVVPCHRVLHSGGGLGGYGGGLDNKVLLLKLEGAIGGAGVTRVLQRHGLGLHRARP